MRTSVGTTRRTRRFQSGRLNKRLSERQVTVLFMFFMVLVLGINVYNICKFF